ncbi:MAG: sugar phosphate isomerase/epimerase [Pseudobutyrivibrio sp.]|nr:sugar phosphate isomerase/epimerase [Pseudobutyrivibrio sp.]
MKTAVQQIMLGKVTGTEAKARETLAAVKKAGYDGIELNSFMINPTPFLVRVLTSLAGMPSGKGGKLDWKRLLDEEKLSVPAVHVDLGSLERDLKSQVELAQKYDATNLVITGMYRFDYRDSDAVSDLCSRLNSAGQKLAEQGIRLLYHNHNYEFQKMDNGQTAFEYMAENTKPEFLSFEMDSYWPTEAGVNALNLMKLLGNRMKLYHINDRGTRLTKPAMTPILKSDSMELGCGNMDLKALVSQAENAGVEYIILETHKNWVDGDPVKSLQVSGEYLRNTLG